MTKTETRNLGELFRESLKTQWYSNKTRDRSRRKREDSGMVGICKIYTNKYTQGYCFEYAFLSDDNSKRKYLYRKTFIDLYNLIVNELKREIHVQNKSKAIKFIDNYVQDEDIYKTLFDNIMEKEVLDVKFED